MINHIKRWFGWARYNTNSFGYKLCVLFGIANSPSFEIYPHIRDAHDKLRKTPNCKSVTVRIHDD